MSEPYSDALRTIQENAGTAIHGALLVVLKHEEERLKEIMVDAETGKFAQAQGGVHELRALGKLISPRIAKHLIQDGGYLDT